jgi:uncharacterized protein YbjQ (UPF0145 family)
MNDINFGLWVAFWVVPIVLGFFFGRHAEAQHFTSIRAREKDFLHLPATTNRVPVLRGRELERSELVYGSMVVAVDYFKRALAALRTIVGGPVQSYETLLDRARREALLRLKASCPGADEIINLRLETSSISKSANGAIGSVEVLAYGTAIYYRPK